MQNNANEMAVFNTAIYVRLSKEDIVAAQSGRESNSITNQKQLILDFLKDKPEFNIVSIRIDDGNLLISRRQIQRSWQDSQVELKRSSGFW
ncbi:hypothetical protein I310019A7_30510 [Lawsonibacter asaccharolyticus]